MFPADTFSQRSPSAPWRGVQVDCCVRRVPPTSDGWTTSVATHVVSGAWSTNSFTPTVVTGYGVTQPTTPVWQTASVLSSSTNCGPYKPRSPPTCRRQPLVIQCQCSACITIVSARVQMCDAKRGDTPNPTCTQQNLASGHHSDAVDEIVQGRDFSRRLSSG